MKINSTIRPGLDKGFNLIELLVVVTIISLLALTILPGTIALFKSGTDSQAHNVMAAMMASARSAAIQQSTYVALHGQMVVEQRRVSSSSNWEWRQNSNAANPLYRPDSNLYRLAILVYHPENTGTGQWVLPPDYAPQTLPGTMVMGQISDGAGAFHFVLDVGGVAQFQNTVAVNVADFMSFTILFSPLGTVVTQLNGEPNGIDLQNAVFSDTPPTRVFTDATVPPPPGIRSTSFWALEDLITAGAAPFQHAEPGVTAVTLFDYMKIESFLPGFPAANPAKAVVYLNDNGQLIPINAYTGQLFPRK